MSPAIYNELGAIPPYNPTDVDSVIVELHDVTDACLVIASDTGMLQTDGSLHCEFPCSLNGGNYYIVIRHRSSLETWSSVPIGMSGNTFYDFSTGASKAYCENMIDVNSEGYGPFIPAIWIRMGWSMIVMNQLCRMTFRMVSMDI